MRVINWYILTLMKDEGSYANIELIYFSVEPLVHFSSVYINSSCSATESQVIILDIILPFISIHRGLLVHNLFPNCTMFVNFIKFNIQQCVTMFYKHRTDCAVDTQYLPVRLGLWCSGCIGL